MAGNAASRIDSHLGVDASTMTATVLHNPSYCLVLDLYPRHSRQRLQIHDGDGTTADQQLSRLVRPTKGSSNLYTASPSRADHDGPGGSCPRGAVLKVQGTTGLAES